MKTLTKYKFTEFNDSIFIQNQFQLKQIEIQPIEYDNLMSEKKPFKKADVEQQVFTEKAKDWLDNQQLQEMSRRRRRQAVATPAIVKTSKPRNAKRQCGKKQKAQVSNQLQNMVDVIPV